MSSSNAQDPSGAGAEVAEADGHLDAHADLAGVGEGAAASGGGGEAQNAVGERPLTAADMLARPDTDPSRDLTPDGTLVDAIIPVTPSTQTVDEFMANLPDDVLIEPIGEVFEETDE